MTDILATITPSQQLRVLLSYRKSFISCSLLQPNIVSSSHAYIIIIKAEGNLASLRYRGASTQLSCQRKAEPQQKFKF